MSQNQDQRSNRGYNAFKRAVARGGVLTDAINPETIGDIINERPNTTMVEDNGQCFVKVLPTRRQRFTDASYLKQFPQYRLVDCEPTTTQTPATTETPVDDSLIDPNLNKDVTEFLSLLNDIGLRISYYYDPENTRTFERTRDIVGGNKLLIDTVSSNIIRGVNELKTFFRCFGKKILPPSLGFNPYHNNDISGLKNPDMMSEKDDCCRRETNVSVNISNNKGVEYPKAPYNPHDLNTYMNCLENLAFNSTQRDPVDDVKDFNLKIFQTFLGRVKTTKFDDEQIDEYLVTRTQPYYNVMHMMIEVLKIDTKFFKILYLLNLHEAFRSPLTGVYYGKSRTRIVDGVPVRYDEVTNSDIYNATIQVVDMLTCVLRMVTFLDTDAYNKIVIDYFSEEAIKKGNNVAAQSAIQIQDTSSNISNGPAQFPTNDEDKENIPCFVYGHLLNFCDAARQIVSSIPLDQEILQDVPSYDPTRVANIAVNTTYGMMAVAQLIEGLLKSPAFRTVMSMLFPGGDFRDSSARMLSEKYRLDRPNNYDLLSLTNYVLEGRLGINKSKIVAPNTIPNHLPVDPIHINKPLYCDINKTLCGLSRFLWNSGSVYLDCDVIPADSGLFNTSIDPYDVPPELTTTVPEDRDLDDIDQEHRGFINMSTMSAVRSENRAVRISTKSSQTKRARFEAINPNTTIEPNNDAGTISTEPYVVFLEEQIPDSIETSNGKVISFLQCYVAAFANHDRETFNDKVRVLNSRSCETKPRLTRDMYNLLTRNMKI